VVWGEERGERGKRGKGCIKTGESLKERARKSLKESAKLDSKA
jgi:hypothetical protein